MTNTNPRWWAWDGTSLETYAHGIEELTEGRGAFPPLRGEDKVIPGAAGRLHRPKVPDARVITLTGWINGADANGVILDEEAWRFSIEAFRNLLWDPVDQHELSKGVLTDAAGTTIRVAADAQCTALNNIHVEDGERGLQIARFSVDFTLAYPFFINGANEYL